MADVTRLRQSPSSVGELAEEGDMEQSAVSHQLRLLRAVTGTRTGRSIVYSLYDNHCAGACATHPSALA
jgi:DNA-binding transcriptional ArsR family regulator